MSFVIVSFSYSEAQGVPLQNFLALPTLVFFILI